MLTRLYLNNTQIAHGPTKSLCLLHAVESGHHLHPRVTAQLMAGSREVPGSKGVYRIEQEPALTAEIVRQATEDETLFSEVAERYAR